MSSLIIGPVPKKKVAPLPKKKVAPNEKVTPSKQALKGTIFLDDMEEPVVIISRQDLDNFRGKSTASTGWYNPGHEWLNRKISTLEPDFYEKLFENIIEGQDIETYKTFVVLLGYTKLNLSMRNDLVTSNKTENISERLFG